MPYHAPNSCQVIKKWLAKCEDDSETRNYLLVYTQDCPKCRVCIEKNGGCSHMTCNRCKHEFCWVCGNDWKSHGASYDCNRYKGNPEQDEAREALNRYTHYYHRWMNHSNSLKFEKAFKEQCKLKIQEKILNKEGGTLVDWEFMTVAVEHLTRARYTLQYTYPYAYHLETDEGKKMLFENIQAELERDVENLSHSLEKVTLNDKFNIESQMNIVEKRRRTLLLDFNS
jgi:ariadne-1